MGFLNNSGVNYLWNKVKDYVDSRAIAGNIKQVRTVSASQSSSLSVNTFGNNITINLSSYGFETTPIVVPQAQGWLEPRVVSVSATSLVVQFYNAGNAAHTGGAKFTLIEAQRYEGQTTRTDQLLL